VTDENSGSGVVLNLVSGFHIRVKPLPPYYVDLIEDVLPLPEFPTRKLVLAAGDVAEWPYEPKDEAADPGHEDYSLYMKWKSVERERESITKKRDKARKDFLISNCVVVDDGPIDFQGDDWVNKVEAAFEDYEVPAHYGKRLLVFLKTQVISTPDELELILGFALQQEATMQGIVHALQGFQHKVEEARSFNGHKKSKVRKH
jgi:hypothetical protein